ncbi:MAG: sugar phosphate isomerase/epimerase [Anaerolineae bacterium]|nr:sugar phosphate isomerase/epimerase [Anaerolineae bacterium]
MRLRLGSTSYVYPADILPNVRRLAGLVEDVELVLFEVADASNLPDAATIAGLQEAARFYGLSYTVHLPTDLQLGAQGEAWASSVEKAQRVIQSTRPLTPWAYVVHLNPDGAEGRDRWQERCLEALTVLAEAAGGPDLLAVENLENCPLEYLVPILERMPVSLCLDVGHLWLAGTDPLPALKAHLGQARVVHLHGVNRRDHASLCWAPADALRAVLGELVCQRYRGVVTLEVFSVEDFFSSRERVLSLLEEMEHWKPD